jgi:5-methylcytosine-specific restriction endonuclease McrA
MAAYRKAWAKAHPEQVAASKAKAYLKHREKKLAYARAYHQRNKERRREQDRAWIRAHPEKNREGVHRYRARRHGAQCVHEECRFAIRLAWARHPHACYLCGVPLKSGRGGNGTIDHVVALAAGGMHCVDNLRPACRPCNSRKGARLVVDS